MLSSLGLKLMIDDDPWEPGYPKIYDLLPKVSDLSKVMTEHKETLGLIQRSAAKADLILLRLVRNRLKR